MRLFRIGTWMLPLLLFAACSSGPELTGEADRRIAEALYTAVTAQRPELLAQIEQRVIEAERSATLSPAAAQHARSIITEARSGAWQSAAERLDRWLRQP